MSKTQHGTGRIAKSLPIPADNIPIVTTISIFVLMYALSSILFPGFFTLYNFVNIFKANAFFGVVAVGMTFVILSGGIDLSVGSVVAFTTIFVAKMYEAHQVPTWISMVACLAIGLSLGFVVGCLITYFHLPAFLVTLVMMFFMRGLAYMVHQGTISINDDPFITFMKRTGIRVATGNLSLYVLVFVAVLVLGIIVARYTQFGRNVYAIGGNESSAVLMGLPVDRTKVLVYTLSGFLSALGGVIFTIHLASGKPHNTVGLELNVIASVVIGGTLLTGGSGRVIGTFFGVLIYGLVFKLPAYIPAFREWWAQILVGVLVLAFILIQTLVTERTAKS